MVSFVLNRYWLILGILISLRIVFWVGAFPNSDEAYYWLWGQHLNWSYFDHPPLHAWIQGIFTTALGRSHFVLRLPTIISTGLLLWLYWLICQQLYRRQAEHAFWLTVLLVLSSPLFFLFLAMAWHDHWLICFGTAASYCLVRFLSQDRLNTYIWLYSAGVLIGLAGLCKYVALLMGLGFLGAIASHHRWRQLFWNGHLYIAIAIALLMMAPVFWWNIQHDFYSFQFYLGRSLQTNTPTIQWLGPVGFLLLSSLIFGPIHSYLVSKIVTKDPSTQFEATYQYVALSVFGISTASLTMLSFKAPVLYYWNILAYPLLFPLIAGIFLNIYRPGNLQYPRLLKVTAVLGSSIAFLLIVHYTIFPLSALISETGDDDTRMLYGWSTVADHVEQQITTLSAPPLLLTTDYRSAAALAYSLRDTSVLAISGRIDQFDFWYEATALDGRDGLLLGDQWHPICPDHLAMFDHTDQPEVITIQRLGILIKQYTLVRGYGFQAKELNEDPLSLRYPLAFTTDGEICAPQVP
ncbi:MAG: glycosyltransferase family 39 protein [Leptolyngbya sp. SIO1D8]|nr:glycosyltransferase family 39 protein [Leptolyngbya sp. SIO1D8]